MSSSNERSLKQSLITNGGLINKAEPRSRKRKSPSPMESTTQKDVGSKRKSARIAQIEETSTPTLSASPEIRESLRIDLDLHLNLDSVEEKISTNGNEFVEPPLAPPSPSYTGLPLEEFPTAKIKKELLWPIKKKSKSKEAESIDNGNYSSSNKNGNISNNNNSSSSGNSNSSKMALSQNPSIENATSIEQKYINHLQTPLSDEITAPSTIRGSLDTSSRPIRQTKLKLTVKTPKQRIQKHTVSPSSSNNDTKVDKSTPKNVLKKIKIISPQKTDASTKLLAPNTKIKNEAEHHQHQHQHAQEEDTHKDNDDFCFSCGRPGIFICCETCPKSFHFTCCDPPLEEPPEDDWFCHECVAKRNASLLPNWKDIGIFGKLLNNLQTRNPKAFELPRALREDTFIGVETGDFGDYADDSEKPDIPASKRNGNQLPGFNRDPDLEIETLYDGDGKPNLCHKCKESGLNHRTLIKCDYCPLIYHIDCLEYPMFGPKTIGDKWRCPNHVSDLLPRGLPQLRQYKNTEIVESSLQTNFLRMMALGNFVVKFDSEQYLKDNRNNNNGGGNSARAKTENANTDRLATLHSLSDWGSDLNAIHPEFQPSLNVGTIVTKDGICQPTPLLKLKITPISSSSKSRIYRIPEKLIIMDFMSKVEKKDNAIDAYTEYEYLSRLEQNPAEKEIIDSLYSIHSRQSQLNFEVLLKAAQLNLTENWKVEKEKEKEEKDRTEDVSNISKDKSIHENNINHNDTLSYKEIQDLIKIKKLMEIKGQDSLLKFLQSK